MAEHGDADRNANSGRGIHGVDGFADVADEAARAAIVQNASDRGRVVFQTGGTRPGRYIADGAGGWEWFGLPDAPDVSYDNSGSGLAATDAQDAIDEVAAGVVSALDSATSAIHVNASGEIDGITEKVSPVSADLLVIEDSENSNAKRKVQVGNLLGGGGAVSSVFGRTGAVVAAASDYNASQVDYDNGTSGLAATDTQAAIDELAAVPGGTSVDHAKLIAVGGASIFTSEDEGQNWSQLTPGASSLLVSLFSIEKGVYVVAGTNGEIFSSVNGTDWVQRTPPASYAGNYSFGFYSRYHKKFFLGGDQGILHYSYDGIFWSAYDFTGDGLMEFGFFTGMDEDENGLLVVADDGNNGNALVYSEDGGETWSQYDSYSGAAVRFRDVVKVPGGNWVAVFADEFDAVAYSSNGKDWTDVDIGENFVNDNLNFVSYIPSSGRIVAAGVSSSPFYSDDGGVTWSAGSFSGSNFAVRDGGYSPFWDALFVVGDGGEVQITRDGTTWSSVPVGVSVQLNGVNSKSLGDLAPERLVSGGGGSSTDPDAIHGNVSGEIAVVTEKVSPVAADLLLIEDSENSNAKRRVQVGNLPGGGAGTDADAVHVNVAGEITGVTSKSPLVGADTFLVEDSAAADAKKSATIADIRITESQISDLDHTDPDAFHASSSGEISALTAVTLSGSDHVLVEDASDGDNKKRVLASEFFGSGTDPDAIHGNVSGEIAVVTEKVSPVAADLLLIEDSENSNAKRRVQVGNLPGGGGGVSLLTPDAINANFEFFDPSGRVISGSDVTQWDSDSGNMSLSGITATDPTLYSADGSGEVKTEKPYYDLFETPGSDSYVLMTGGNGLTGSLFGAWAANEHVYICAWGYWSKTGEFFGIENLTLATSAGQVGSFVRRNYDSAFAKFRASISAENSNFPAFWELIYRRLSGSYDCEVAMAMNGRVYVSARISNVYDYTLDSAPTNFYIGDDGSGTGSSDGAGTCAVKRIAMIRNYIPTQTERLQLYNWAAGSTFFAK